MKGMSADTLRAIRSGFDFAKDSPSLILRAAAVRLDESYWIKGQTATAYFNESERRRYDLIGVLLATTGFEVHEGDYRDINGNPRGISPREKSAGAGVWAKKNSNFELWSRSITRKARQGYLKCLDYVIEVTGEYDVELWNDEVAQDKEDVIGVLMHAADIAESRGE